MYVLPNFILTGATSGRYEEQADVRIGSVREAVSQLCATKSGTRGADGGRDDIDGEGEAAVLLVMFTAFLRKMLASDCRVGQRMAREPRWLSEATRPKPTMQRGQWIRSLVCREGSAPTESGVSGHELSGGKGPKKEKKRAVRLKVTKPKRHIVEGGSTGNGFTRLPPTLSEPSSGGTAGSAKRRTHRILPVVLPPQTVNHSTQTGNSRLGSKELDSPTLSEPHGRVDLRRSYCTNARNRLGFLLRSSASQEEQLKRINCL